MKIGILTYHAVYNFGANLQAYSTIGYLRNHGHEPFIINWMPKDLEEGYKKNNPSNQVVAHQHFIEKHFPLTRLCRNSDDVLAVIKDYNIERVLIGSDAVLQHRTFLSRIMISKRGVKLKPRRSNLIYPNPFWGEFIPKLHKDIPVSLMSVSSQNTNYRLIRCVLKRRISKSLKLFKNITVRDDWTSNMVRYLTGNEISPDITPDPVFNFNQNIPQQSSREEVQQKFNLPDRYILFSFKNTWIVTEKWLHQTKSIFEKEGYTCVLLTMPGGIVFQNPEMKIITAPLDPLDWYSIIKYSSGYIGENMHPVVVAIHNNVPFFAFDSYGIVKFKFFVNEQSSKIHNLLYRSDFLENRTGTLGKGYKIPGPESVFRSIEGFDSDKCKVFSETMQEKYIKMMKTII